MTGIIAISLFVLGAVGGSFAGAQVWRLRLMQLQEDKAAGEEFDAHELKHLSKLASSHTKNDRSRCLTCGCQLAWQDMIPVVSWLALGGKCRKCRTPIGRTELLLEIGMGLFLAGSYLAWPYSLQSALDIFRFIVWVIMSVVLAILLVYDARWYILPNKLNWSFIAISGLFVLTLLLQEGWPADVQNIVGSIAILSGIYLILFVISKGAWIGFGDIKLGLGLGLLLTDWTRAFLALFLANLIGCLVVLPGLVAKKIKRTSHVPFGPFLIVGALIAFFWGEVIIQWYMEWGAKWAGTILFML